ncbi:MAG: TldD/PmbA family protein [Methanomassiliicoccales archaeon]
MGKEWKTTYPYHLGGLIAGPGSFSEVVETSIQELAMTALKMAKKEGADHAEAYVTKTRSLSAYLDNSSVKSVEEKHDAGLAVRVIKDGRVGQSSTSFSSQKQLEACVRRAMHAASLLPQDAVFKGFSFPVKEQVKVRNRDPAVASVTPQLLTELAVQLISSVQSGNGVKVPTGVIRAADFQSVVANTNELMAHREATLLHVLVTAMTEGPFPGEGVEKFHSPCLKDLNVESLGSSLRIKALAASKAQAFQGHSKVQAIIPPHELADMLQGSVCFALSAENVNRKRSPFSSQMERKVASRSLTLIDDPSDKRGMLSSPFDDEGVPTKKRMLIKEGILKGFLYDLYNSYLSRTAPTGNGLRRSATETIGSYQLPVSIGPICLVLKPGSHDREDMIAEMKHGLVVEKVASAEVHPITGDFGLEIRLAHLVENGERKCSLKHCLLSGNMFRALNQIVEVGKDATVSQNAILPSVLFDDLELVGGE